MSTTTKVTDFLKKLGEKALAFLKYQHYYIVGFLFVVLLGVLFELAGWWYLMLLAGGFAGFLMKKSAISSFVIGFAGIALVWFCFFVYFMIIGPLFELTALIASILGFLEGSSEVLVLITIIIGGLLGGLGAITGTYIAGLIYPTETPSEKVQLKGK
jgi:hypothetical protein